MTSAVTLQLVNDIETSRGRAFAALTRCPVCGAGLVSAEKSDVLEVLEFACEASFFRQIPGMAAVARVCPAPSYVAMRAIENEACTAGLKAVRI